MCIIYSSRIDFRLIGVITVFTTSPVVHNKPAFARSLSADHTSVKNMCSHQILLAEHTAVRQTPFRHRNGKTSARR